jgi:molybdopterin-binding protein
MALMRQPMVDLKDEAAKLTDLLRGKIVKVVRGHRSREVMIEFDDGTRLFVDNISDELEFSVTGGAC